MIIAGPPNGPVLFCSLVSVVCRLLASSVTLPARGLGRACGRLAAAGSGAWVVGRLILHGGPERLRPFRATPC